MASSCPSNLHVSLNSSKRQKSSSVDAVLGNDDLLTEILCRLPAKLVLKFKLVSKKWLSLISHHSFAIRHTQLDPHTFSSLLLRVSFLFKQPSIYQNVSLDGKNTLHHVPTDYFRFDHDNLGNTSVSESCNGLLLCWRKHWYSSQKPNYYVFNPITRQSVELTLPPGHGIHRIQLLFDPSVSPHYKVLCIQHFKSVLEIHVYSPQTKIWKRSVKQENFDSKSVNFCNGVFWNGAVHWISSKGDGFCFLPDKECLQPIPRPLLPESWESNSFRYFGESGGRLQFIGLLTGDQNPEVLNMGINVSPDMSSSSGSSSHFGSQYIVVYAMEKDCSKWFLKYYLDVNTIAVAYPEIIEDPILSSCLMNGCISVSAFFEEKNELGALLVMNLPGEIISYSFKDRAFKKMFSFHPYKHYTCHTLKYSETLCWV